LEGAAVDGQCSVIVEDGTAPALFVACASGLAVLDGDIVEGECAAVPNAAAVGACGAAGNAASRDGHCCGIRGVADGTAAVGAAVVVEGAVSNANGTRSVGRVIDATDIFCGVVGEGAARNRERPFVPNGTGVVFWSLASRNITGRNTKRATVIVNTSAVTSVVDAGSAVLYGGAETAFHYFDCTFVVYGTAILVGLAVLDGDALQLERGTGADMYTSAIIVVTARNDTATRS